MSDFHPQPFIVAALSSHLALEVALLSQACVIADEAIARAGITLSVSERDWIVMSLHNSAACVAEIKPGQDVMERCAKLNERAAADHVRWHTNVAA